MFDSLWSLLNGDGSVADFTNSYGQNYLYNQTGYDMADNGAITQNGTSTTASSPSWLTGLTGLLNGLVPLASTVKSFTSTPSTTSAGALTANQVRPPTTTTAANFMPWIIGGAVALLAVVFIVKR